MDQGDQWINGINGINGSIWLNKEIPQLAKALTGASVRLCLVFGSSFITRFHHIKTVVILLIP